MTQPHFDGATYVPTRDHGRLTTQLASVLSHISDHEWWTLDDLSHHTDHPQASVSARLRDLRKAKFGGHHIARRYVGAGLYEYRLIAPNTGS